MEEIKKAVQSILPNLPQVEEVCKHLVRSGVETVADLKYVKPRDLPMLKVIQVRKLIDNWTQEATPSQTSEQTALVNKEIRFQPVASTSTTKHQTETSALLRPTIDVVWAEKFEIPWSKFPIDLQSCLQRRLRPTPPDRKEMVRILVDEICKIDQQPSTRALISIAQKIVKTYPESFLDKVQGIRIGTGYDSLLKQLRSRFYYKKRKSNDDSRGLGASPTKKIRLDNKYGCINYMPIYYPGGESKATQEEKRGLLKQKYKQNPNDEVKKLIKDTYPSQRKDIIEKKMNVLNLQTEWPCLFEQTGMFVHFRELTGIDIREKIQSAITNMRTKILKWIEEQPSKPIRKIRLELALAKCFVSNSNPEVTAMICAAMAYLHEKEEFVYVCIKPTATKTELKKALPQTPCLIGIGESRLSATRYMLSIDGVVVSDHIASFATGLAMLFASYYIFDIPFPAESASTLEFIQRYFVGIHPERGSKTEIKRCKTHIQVHPKVLSLVNAIDDAGWRSYMPTSMTKNALSLVKLKKF